MENGVVAHGVVLDSAGIDDVVHGAVFHQADDLIADLRVSNGSHVDADGGNGPGGILGGIDADALIVAALGDGNGIREVLVLNGQKHAGVILFTGGGQMEAGSGQAFEQRFRLGDADAQHFTGGLHFRSEDGVSVVQLLKGEDRYLDGTVGRDGIESGAVAQILQGLIQHDAGSEIHHGNACDL